MGQLETICIGREITRLVTGSAIVVPATIGNNTLRVGATYFAQQGDTTYKLLVTKRKRNGTEVYAKVGKQVNGAQYDYRC